MTFDANDAADGGDRTRREILSWDDFVFPWSAQPPVEVEEAAR